MLRPRHRVKSNLLWKMLGIALLVNVVLWPLLIHLGAFRGVRQELIPVTLVAQPSPPKAPPVLSKAPAVVSKAPKPTPVIPAPKPKPVLAATAPPVAVRPPVSVVLPKPPAPVSMKTASRPAPRRFVRTHRRTHSVLMAKAAPQRDVQDRKKPRIAVIPAPARPKQKPTQRIASRPLLPIVAKSEGPPTPPTPEKNADLPSEDSAPHLQPAVAIVQTQPSIPESMQNSAWHAVFRGQFVVGKNGHVMPQMVSSTGSHVLDARALKAARHWKFRPATRNGTPVASTVKFEIEYAVRAVP